MHSQSNTTFTKHSIVDTDDDNILTKKTISLCKEQKQNCLQKEIWQ